MDEQHTSHMLGSARHPYLHTSKNGYRVNRQVNRCCAYLRVIVVSAGAGTVVADIACFCMLSLVLCCVLTHAHGPRAPSPNANSTFCPSSNARKPSPTTRNNTEHERQTRNMNTEHATTKHAHTSYANKKQLIQPPMVAFHASDTRHHAHTFFHCCLLSACLPCCHAAWLVFSLPCISPWIALKCTKISP